MRLKPGRRKSGASLRTAQRLQLAQRRQRWQQRLGSVTVLLLVTLIGWWGGGRLLDPVHFPLRQVHLYGELRYLPEAELRRLLVPYMGQNFFLFDLAGLRARLAANPWLVDVAARREWPGGLVINVRERRVFARWGEHELIDTEGQRFRPPSLPQSVPGPVLSGPDGQEKIVMEACQRANSLLAPLGLSISHLTQDERLAWQLKLDNGLLVTLSKDDTGSRVFLRQLRRLVTVYPVVLAPQLEQIAAVDMRYDRGFSVRWALDIEPVSDADRIAGHVKLAVPVSAGSVAQYWNESLNAEKS